MQETRVQRNSSEHKQNAMRVWKRNAKQDNDWYSTLRELREFRNVFIVRYILVGEIMKFLLSERELKCDSNRCVQ